MARALAVLALVLTLAACGSGPTIDYDSSVDFNGYQRYQWLDERSGASDEFDPLLAKRVRNGIEAELQRRRFTPAEGNPDFLVRYYVGSTAQVSEPRSRGSVGLGSFGGNVGMGVSIGIPLGGSRVQQQAQILIDFLDPATKALTWRGSEIVTLRADDPAKVTEQVQGVVRAILDKFPPKAE
jgi:hypothetical protein